jgi:hypothetical protein
VGADNFVDRVKDGFMGNLQYIAKQHVLSLTHCAGSIPRKYVTQTAPIGFEPPAISYSFLHKTVYSLIPTHLHLALRSPRVAIGIGVGVVAAIGFASYVFTRRKPTAEEIERERRELLARSGRITDGTIMDTMVSEVRNAALSAEALTPVESSGLTPQIIVYNYRIAGVTYECAQDVTSLAEYVHGIRTDLPVQVRYLPQNPANSIIVAESWSGLRLSSSNPYQAD